MVQASQYCDFAILRLRYKTCIYIIVLNLVIEKLVSVPACAIDVQEKRVTHKRNRRKQRMHTSSLNSQQRMKPFLKTRMMKMRTRDTWMH